MLTPQIAPQVVAQCQVAAGEIGQAFTRALGHQIEASVGEPILLCDLEPPEQLQSPGVIVTLHFGPVAMAIVVPQTGGLLPRGYDSGDPVAQSKLTSLAQELGMLVLPEALLAEDVQGFCVADLAGALGEGGLADGACAISLSLNSSGKQVGALIIWPLSAAKQITKIRASAAEGSPAQHAQRQPADAQIDPAMGEGIETSSVSSAPGDSGSADVAARQEELGDTAASIAASRPRPGDPPITATSGLKRKGGARGSVLRDLPPYSRSLLKIRVPLSVTLAEKKQPLGQILEIGPGSILQFEKSCEEMLDLNVSNLAIARGEAVKVGDKFGLRVTSLILPSERFKAVQPAPQPSLATA